MLRPTKRPCATKRPPIGGNLSLCEVMVAWETPGSDLSQPEYIRDFARIWKAARKVVYSHTLDLAPTARTSIVRQFDPHEVRRMKSDLESDMLIGGPTLAAAAIGAGLVGEYHVFVAPVVVGGLRILPNDVRMDLELMDERRLASGMVFLQYGSKAC